MIATEMLAAGKASVAEIRNRISNVRYGPTAASHVERILFDLDDNSYVATLQGRNRDYVLTGGESDKGLALRTLLDGHAARESSP